MDKYSENIHRAFHEVYEVLNRYKGFDVAYGDHDEDIVMKNRSMLRK